jgi:hypothetical protein
MPYGVSTRWIMKTREFVIENYTSECIDYRDTERLVDFFPYDRWAKFGFKLRAADDYVPIEWTRENILKQLESDVKFGYEKALDERGISASLMYHVVKMWCWILEDGLEDFDDYGSYGMPLFQAVAKQYNIVLS